MGHVEPLDRARARPAGSPRQLAIDPDFCVIVDIRPQHRHRAGGVETRGISRDRKLCAVPEERHHAAAPPGPQLVGGDHRPPRIVEPAHPCIRLYVVGCPEFGHGVRQRRALDDLRLHPPPLRAENRRPFDGHQIDHMHRRQQRSARQVGHEQGRRCRCDRGCGPDPFVLGHFCLPFPKQASEVPQEFNRSVKKVTNIRCEIGLNSMTRGKTQVFRIQPTSRSPDPRHGAAAGTLQLDECFSADLLIRVS